MDFRHLNYEEILSLKCATEDLTIAQFLQALLLNLWEEKEMFSGKRPLGNSDWKYEIYTPLVSEGIVKGSIDEFGFLESIDSDYADALVKDMISCIFCSLSGV